MPTPADRAVATNAAMQRALYVEGRGLYRLTTAADSPLAYAWEFSRALLGGLCLAGVRGIGGGYAATRRSDIPT